jgi:hypothetical protein
MERKWYYQLMGTTVGPLSGDELREHAADGQIDPNTLVRNGEQGTWVLADKVRGLLDNPTRIPSSKPAHVSPSAPSSSDANTKAAVTQQWYVCNGDTVEGPLSSSDFKSMARAGTVRANARVRLGESGAWVLADTIVGLKGTFGSEIGADSKGAARWRERTTEEKTLAQLTAIKWALLGIAMMIAVIFLFGFAFKAVIKPLP